MEKVTLDKGRIEFEKKRFEGKGTGKKKRFTNQDVASGLLFSDEKEVYQYYKGAVIDYWRVKNLADIFGVRVEYLTGQDDFRTEDDLHSYLTITENDRDYAILNYLKTLGLDLSLAPCCICSDLDLWFLYNSNTRAAISNDGLNSIVSKIDVNLSEKEAIHLYDYTILENIIELKPSATRIFTDGLHKLIKGPNNYSFGKPIEQDFATQQSIYSTNKKTGERAYNFRGYYEILYKTSLNDKYIGYMSFNNTHLLFRHIDSLVRSSISTLLQNGLLLNHFFQENLHENESLAIPEK